MDAQQVILMNGGEGETSYFKNSLYQKGVILKVQPVVEESITELYCKTQPECLKVADLGCSSGPNALLPLWEVIETIDKICSRLNRKSPQLQAFLNDLPGNDFNTIFRLLPSFYGKLHKEKGINYGPCFIAGTPGSFHERLFPDNSIHFFHSSYSLQFLSQVPQGLTTELGMPLNKGNFIMAKTSPPSVCKAYANQFVKDLTKFLRLRSKELISGGHMVCTFMCRSNDMNNPSCTNNYEILELLGITLNYMVKEGLIEESTLDECNVPVYAASAEEVKLIIETEGSFKVVRLETFERKWDADFEDGNIDERGNYVAKFMRAAAEPFLSSHFGNDIIDGLFQRYASKVVNYIEMGTGLFYNLVVSMIKK